MKRFFFFLASTLVLLFPAEAQLTNAERSQAVEYFQKTKTDLLKSVEGLNTAQLTYKPAPDRWSVAECLEHITLFEYGMFQFLQDALKVSADPAQKSGLQDDALVQLVTDRSKKAQTPEAGKPTGKFPSAAVALNAFGERRDQTIAYLKTTPDDLRHHFWQHPAYGTMDLYQMALVMAAHGERHRLQIEEVKASQQFPQ